MRWNGPFILAVVLCVVPLAGCVGENEAAVSSQAATDVDAAGPLVQVLEDPEGDAVEGRPAFGTTTWARCDLVYRPSDVQSECRDVANTLGGQPLPEEGVPAVPAVDILGVTLQETPAYLVVELQLAALDATFDEALPSDGETLRFVVYLGPDLGSQVNLNVRRFGAPAGLGVESYAVNNECQGGPSACMWRVAYDLQEGTPGAIRWFVEREFLPDGGAGGVVTGDDAGIIRTTGAGPSAAVSYGTPAGEVRSRHHNVAAYLLDHVIDGSTFTFENEMMPFPNEEPRGVFVDIDGDPWLDPAHREFDIQRFVVAETPETITLGVELARVGEGPPDHYLEMDLALLGGAYLQVWLESLDGTYHDYTSVCPEPDCTEWRFIPAELVVVPGEPGWVNVTVSRRDIGSPRAGAVTRYLDIEMEAFGDGAILTGNPGGVGFSVSDPNQEGGLFDDIDPAPGYRFQFDTLEPSSEGTHLSIVVEDPSNDVEPGPLVGAADVARFDVTFVEARGESPGLTRLTLGIDDLSRVAVPTGYEAAVYAAAVENELGSFMVGFYLESGGRQEFFCSQDTMVLVDPKTDPLEVIRQVIDGSISVVDRRDAEGGGGASAITFLAPHACFSQDGDGALAGARMGAGTYLVQNPLRLREGEVTALDMVERDAPFTVQAVAPRGSRYATPFGISNFWDMAGIGLAAIAMVAAGGLKLQHRRRDKRAVANAKLREDRDVYKAALAKAVARGTHDPDDDEVLQALRRRLGIGEREHALMLLEARAAAGLADGLDVGGTFLGKYVIERVLGEGGFARTFLARDKKLDRRVVLKVARWEDPKEAARALKEARTLARLNHPNIVTIYDAEEVAGQVVLVLEHVAQGSLAGVLARGPITAGEALSVTHDVLAALEAAHAQGIIHRDVKPANILLGANGRAKLCDFGIARRGAGAGTATGASLGGDGAGTLLYMAPEQARGLPADERTDLYAVGAVLYEMLTGHTYVDFEGLGDFEVRKAIVEEEPDLPLEKAPQRVNAALRQALAKDASERPASAAEMATLLR